MGSIGQPVTSQSLLAVTICARRKPGMSEDDYHNYISKIHAGHLKELLVQKKIVDYTMQHNTTSQTQTIQHLFPNLPTVNVAPYDAIVQIVFRSVEDYIAVKDDEHYKKVVNPDHVNFADAKNTLMSVGWFERHVWDGKLVE